MVHEGVLYKCKICDFTNKHQSELRIHKQTIHEGFRFKCSRCPFEAKRKNNLRTHNEIKHEGVKFYCDQCEFSALSQSSIKTHIEAQHGGREYRMIVTSATTADKATDDAIYFARMARLENLVLGNALEGVPESEDVDNSPQVEDPEKMTDEELGEIEEKVDKALEENLDACEKSESPMLRHDVVIAEAPTKDEIPVTEEEVVDDKDKEVEGEESHEDGTEDECEHGDSVEAAAVHEAKVSKPTIESIHSARRVDRKAVRRVVQSMKDALDRGEVGEFECASTREVLDDVLTGDSVRNTELHDAVKYGSLPRKC